MTGPRSATSSSHGSGIPPQQQQQQQLLQQQQQLLTTSHSRPPAQVYTRGTTGAVKTRNRDNLQRQQQQTQQAQQQPHRRTPSQTRQDELLVLGRAGRSRRGDRSVQSEASASTNRSVNTSRSNRSAGPWSGKNSISKQDAGGMAPELAKLHVKVARRVTEELTRACTAPDKRIAAITSACETLDHADEARHNIELYHGAATALAKLLIVTSKDDEIRMILSATEMVFRASPKAVTAAFNKLSSGQQFFQQLLRLLHNLETRQMRHAEISILNISKIIYSCSRSSELRAVLVRVPGMLPALARVSSNDLNAASRLHRIRILANLSNCEENKVILYETKHLLEAVLRIAHFDEQPAARQCAATALMELSSAPALQVSMASSDSVLGTLVKLILVEKSSVTRESAITAIQNLAYAKENRLTLILFKSGIVLEALKKALAGDFDAKARRRSAGALTNLACDDTAGYMGRHSGLLETLAVTATKDESPDVQTRASLALTKIASSITVDMDCHSSLLDALVTASLSRAPNSVSAVLRVKARSPENRVALARHTGIMDTLCDIVVSEGVNVTDRDNSVRAIMHLVNDDGNHKMLCSKSILTAMVTAANYKDPDLTEARDSAIRALGRLATEVSNRAVMAHHEGLLVAVARAVEREAKWEQTGHRSGESEYLAKPLLMSLLVAM